MPYAESVIGINGGGMEMVDLSKGNHLRQKKEHAQKQISSTSN